VNRKVHTYEGELPYIFISYSHKDRQRVMLLVQGLQERGYRVWFDQGIRGGEEWPAYIAQHLNQCAVFLPVFTQNYMESRNCMREIHYALKMDRNILPVYMEDVRLADGLDMQLSHIQALWYSPLRNTEDFWDSIERAIILDACDTDRAVAATPARNVGTVWLLLLGGILLLALGLLLSRTFFRPDTPGPEVPSTVETVPSSLPLNSMMMKTGEDYAAATSPMLRMDITRDQVQTVTFLNTLDLAPENATDASLLNNGSVLAWAVPSGRLETIGTVSDQRVADLYDVYIAAEGGVYAPEDASNLFTNMGYLESIRFNNAFFTDYTKDFSDMFSWCTALTELDLSGFNTQNGTDFFQMFAYSFYLKELNLESFDTSNAVTLSGMFTACEDLEQLDLGHFDTSGVEDMEYMFCGCAMLKELNVSGFDTSGVWNMDSMFRGCCSLTDLDVRGFDFSQATDVHYMFGGCDALGDVLLDNCAFPCVEVYDNFMSPGMTVNGQPWEALFAPR